MFLHRACFDFVVTCLKLNTTYRVFETAVAEEEARTLAERLKTAAGRKRQKMILEHAEDIEELSVFFKDVV